MTRRRKKYRGYIKFLTESSQQAGYPAYPGTREHTVQMIVGLQCAYGTEDLNRGIETPDAQLGREVVIDLSPAEARKQADRLLWYADEAEKRQARERF